MAETFGPAVNFWQGVALTAWYICEGPMSRTTIAGLRDYHERDLNAIDAAGTPIHPSLFGAMARPTGTARSSSPRLRSTVSSLWSRSPPRGADQKTLQRLEEMGIDVFVSSTMPRKGETTAHAEAVADEWRTELELNGVDVDVEGWTSTVKLCSQNCADHMTRFNRRIGGAGPQFHEDDVGAEADTVYTPQWMKMTREQMGGGRALKVVVKWQGGLRMRATAGAGYLEPVQEKTSQESSEVMNPDNMTEDQILDLDDDELRDDLEARLRALPYDAYLRTVLRMTTELRSTYADDLTGQREDLVDRTIELTRAFVGGRADRAAAARVDRAWVEFTGFDPDDEESSFSFTDDTGLQGVCIGVAWELSGRSQRYNAADAFGQAAAVYDDWDIPGQNIRMLLRFIDYTKEATLLVN
jgi:hypothetical protein